MKSALGTPATVLVCTHNQSMAAELGNRCLIIGEDRRLSYDGPIELALNDLALLESAYLAHRHRRGGREHAHLHDHDWESSLIPLKGLGPEPDSASHARTEYISAEGSVQTCRPSLCCAIVFLQMKMPTTR
jgi:hypothetical protein